MNLDNSLLTPYYPSLRPAQPDLNEFQQPPAHLVKNVVFAYMIWYFLGLFGGHHFYTGRRKSGWGVLALSLTIIGLPIALLWWAIDAFYLYKRVHRYNDTSKQQFKPRLYYYEYSSVFVQ
ncbi:TM2 domain-containing protein [Paenibacillus sp. GCM10012307]|uniref:TM2 domain-containing protein n=1 Tax=Paenibacillus roseus TaxID=2798579 RepID=A0A934J3V7_9BACL|nr:TM2 domain-containing protein [Paenibacillus roseus]MBJ6361159.1 TM2 domain-containing protein [Paenibacillus roseus]